VGEKAIKLGRYRHYKGKNYRVMGIGRHTETGESYVVYMGLYTSKEFGKNPLWIRPIKLFLEKVTYDGKKVPRFTYLGRQ
jgi:cyclomaltodextrinase / maltogenic alpha-amylase / neopullulanase